MAGHGLVPLAVSLAGQERARIEIEEAVALEVALCPLLLAPCSATRVLRTLALPRGCRRRHTVCRRRQRPRANSACYALRLRACTRRHGWADMCSVQDAGGGGQVEEGARGANAGGAQGPSARIG